MGTCEPGCASRRSSSRITGTESHPAAVGVPPPVLLDGGDGQRAEMRGRSFSCSIRSRDVIPFHLKHKDVKGQNVVPRRTSAVLKPSATSTSKQITVTFGKFYFNCRWSLEAGG